MARPAACRPHTETRARAVALDVRPGAGRVSYLKRVAASAAAFFVLMIALVLFSTASLEAKMREDRLWLDIGGTLHRIDIELAETAAEKARGLMFRTSLPENRGMLFPHSPPQEAAMWMRNTYISLDMVFIRSDGVIHRIEERTEPMSERIISSEGRVAAVLELAGGVAAKLGLKPGHIVRHALFNNEAR